MKRYYGMTKGFIVTFAPFSVIYREIPVMFDWKPQLLQGYVVVDKSGDKVWPSYDVTTEAAARAAAEELNLVAAKHFMESEVHGKK
jgi:hypothetical protein